MILTTGNCRIPTQVRVSDGSRLLSTERVTVCGRNSRRDSYYPVTTHQYFRVGVTGLILVTKSREVCGLERYLTLLPKTHWRSGGSKWDTGQDKETKKASSVKTLGRVHSKVVRLENESQTQGLLSLRYVSLDVKVCCYLRFDLLVFYTYIIIYTPLYTYPFSTVLKSFSFFYKSLPFFLFYYSLSVLKRVISSLKRLPTEEISFITSVFSHFTLPVTSLYFIGS